MHFIIIKLTLIITFIITCVIGQERDILFVKLHLIDFDRTAAQVINGENNKRMANKQPLLIFSYNLMKLADREVLKLAKIDKISTPDLNTILNMKNVIAKVDKYSSFVDTSNKNFQLARKCSDNYSTFVYKSWYNLNENCISDNEFNKTTDYGFARAFDSFGNVFFIQLFAFDKISADDDASTFNRLDWP